VLTEDDALAAELNKRINEFNARATGIDDGRLLQAELRDDEGALLARLTGWTCGGCGYIDVLWVREDRRGRRLGRRLLNAAETEANERGCTQMVTCHSFQAPEMYRARGYVEYGRIDGYPRGFAHVDFVKDLSA
jgi:GNAT superfamily N-acetyltransferase